MNSMREHAELLSSVRDDISEYKVIKIKIENYIVILLLYSYIFSILGQFYPPSLQASGSMSPRMQLLRERAAIHGSISHVRLKCCSSLLLKYVSKKSSPGISSSPSSQFHMT